MNKTISMSSFHTTGYKGVLKQILTTLAYSFVISSAMVFPETSNAQENGGLSDLGCKDANIISSKLITDICWDCVLPIRIAGFNLSGDNENIPKKASKKRFCNCDDGFGITASMFEPARLIEFQRVAGCSSVLGGVRMFPGDRINQGNHDGNYDLSDMTFVHYHYYAFPLFMLLNLFIGKQCNPGGYVDLDVLYFSELDATWNNDALSFFTSPEAALLSNSAATMACIPETISVNAGKQPIEQLFWCAGSWGTIYPLSGHVAGSKGILNASSLLKTRVLASLHRRGLAWNTMGDEALCSGTISPAFDKTQYKFALTYPVAETKKSHWIGESVMKWGIAKKYPGVQDPIYTIFRWKDCCVTFNK